VPLTYRTVVIQAFVVLVTAAVLLPVGREETWSALLAGAVSVIPNALFAWQSERLRSPGRLVASGVLRFLLTVTLLGVVMAMLRPAPLGFFGAFAMGQLAFVVAPLLDRGAS
jgi:F0F1-type ATP synthase assembly protein I